VDCGQTGDLGSFGSSGIYIGGADAKYNNIEDNQIRYGESVVRRDTATGGTTNTISLDEGSGDVRWWPAYKNRRIKIVSGKGVGQDKLITDESGDNIITVTVDSNWVTIPDTTSVFEIYSRPAYGIRNSGSYSRITNNDLYHAGVTANFSDAGTGTVTTAGNRTS
jgi:hypothetical protein